MKLQMSLSLISRCATAPMMRQSRVFIVVNEEEKEEEKKIPIKDLYFEILNVLLEYYDYDYDSDKRGKMTMPKGTRPEKKIII